MKKDIDIFGDGLRFRVSTSEPVKIHDKHKVTIGNSTLYFPIETALYLQKDSEPEVADKVVKEVVYSSAPVGSIKYLKERGRLV